MTNLFAYRSTDPEKMKDIGKTVPHVAIGELNQCRCPQCGLHENWNDAHLINAWTRCPITVACWGNDGAFANRANYVISLLRPHTEKLWCFGFTGKGQPRHPLYLRKDSELMRLMP